MSQRRSLPSAIAVVLLTFGISPAPFVHAQSELARPSASLARLPSLAWEVWPGDFDGDGRIDLVAGRETPQLVLQRGHADGSVGTEEVIADGLNLVLGVGDINGDGRLDILAAPVPSSPSLLTTSYVLAGYGNGTFAAPVSTHAALRPPTYIADLDGDGRNDLVSPGVNELFIYRGSGNFTFTQATSLATGQRTEGIVVTDLDGDTFPDIAAVAFAGRTLDVFQNIGGFGFTRKRTPLERPGLGVAAGDLNRDGIVDLVTSTADGGLTPPRFSNGFVEVRLGSGGGNYESPRTFATNNGPRTVALGDFNGDGVPDVATGNQSAFEECDFDLFLWDSVSMLPGAGDGNLGAPASLALGNSESIADRARYRQRHHRLHAADLNADGWTDLIASPGAILTTRPELPNRPPVVDAGPDRLEPHEIFDTLYLPGQANDPDSDWMTFEWTDERGRALPASPRTCVPFAFQGTHTFTLTARDGRGGASSDSMTWTFSSGTTTEPAGWTSSDVGAVGATGFTLYGTVNSRPTITLSATGTDIWGTSDAFRFAYGAVSGDFEITALVTAVQDTDPWTKAGLMIRPRLTADSQHASVFVTPSTTNGVVFQRREVDGGRTIHTSGPQIVAPVELRLRREGDVISAFVKRFPLDWEFIGSQTLQGLPETVYVGPALTSHNASALATARFADVVITRASPSLPAGWAQADIDTAGGSTSFDGSRFTVVGSGADIWGTSDQFHYAYTTLPGDGVAVVRVTGLSASHEWAKAGLMIRGSLDHDAPHHYLLLSGSNGLAYQRRPVAGASTVHTTLDPRRLPTVWYRIERSGSTIRLSYSLAVAYPTTWEQVGESEFQQGDALIGLAVTSHAAGETVTASFDNVSVTFGPRASPDWAGKDVGGVGITGSSIRNADVLTLTASGADIWGATDAFHYVYRVLAGNGSVTARVSSLAAPNPWSKAGVMVRASTAPEAAHAFMLVSRDHGTAFQRRVTSDAATTFHRAGGTDAAPQWVRLTRTGTAISAAYSTDGISWIDVGSEDLGIGTGPVLVGLALTSHDDSQLATATFDHVSVTAP